MREAGPMTGEIRLTRVAKHGGALLGKRIVADENGSPVSDGSPCAMARGTAARVRLERFAGQQSRRPDHRPWFG